MGAEQFSVETGKRRERRARVLLAAKLRAGSCELAVRLRDLSRRGALIESASILPAGTAVVFERAETLVPARIAWSQNGRMGLEFERMIEENEVLVHVGRPTAKPPEQRFRRPRVGGPDLTDDERRLVRLWERRVGIRVPRD